jgi:hypothetical protein
VKPAASIPLFSYGTLQQPEVQLANYGRLLAGEPDVLIGYELTDVVIDDPGVVEISGKAIHKIARATGNLADRIAGMVFLLTAAELSATDAYETAAYARTEVRLESGRAAFVYIDSAR